MSADTGHALMVMLSTPVEEWWRFIPCPTCYAVRQTPCSGARPIQRLGDRPHVDRTRAGRELYHTLALLTTNPEKVTGPIPARAVRR